MKDIATQVEILFSQEILVSVHHQSQIACRKWQIIKDFQCSDTDVTISGHMCTKTLSFLPSL